MNVCVSGIRSKVAAIPFKFSPYNRRLGVEGDM